MRSRACAVAVLLGTLCVCGAARAGGKAAVRVETPMPPPNWALLQRELLRANTAACKEFFARYDMPPEQRLKALIAEEPFMSRALKDAVFDTPVGELSGYAANVKSMVGPGYALLGNAAEFLDPIFSSGITIGMRSSSMAVAVLDRFRGSFDVTGPAGARQVTFCIEAEAQVGDHPLFKSAHVAATAVPLSPRGGM